MKKAIIACLLLVVTSPLWAKAQYTTADSIKVVRVDDNGNPIDDDGNVIEPEA